jgi:predicted Zn finger-like uncharacterized protein
MIISCPHCQTKYQVTYEAIGSAGRKVQCAHCQQAWDQPPIAKDEPPPAIRKAEQAIEEDGLDDAMSAQDKADAVRPDKAADDKAAKAAKLDKQRAAKEAKDAKVKKPGKPVDQASAGKIDPSVIRRRRKAFSRPDRPMLDEVPLARLRLALRLVGATALVGVLAFAYLGRVQVVQRFPAMAGVYGALGMGINVVGLDFAAVSAMQTLRNGKEVLIVSAQIVGLSPSPVAVPAVVVTLIGADGHGVYQWSVQPTVTDLMAGERSTFDTQLTLPPGEASRVRLSFAGGSGFRAGTTQPAAPAAGPGADAGGHAMEAPVTDGAAPAHADPAAPEHADTAAPEHADAAAHDAAAEPSHGDTATPEHATPEHN